MTNAKPLPAEMLRLDSNPLDLHGEIRELIERAILEHPRSLQREIGASEIGTPCTRKLAYKLGDIPAINARRASWRATVGVAVHAWLAESVMLENQRLGWTRYLVEQSVVGGHIDAEELGGHFDVYDRLTGAVIDWKVVGITTLKHVRKNGPGQSYQVQGQTYGKGVEDAGLPVRTVHIVFLPQSGELSDAVYWHAPYDRQIAEDALAKATAVAQLGKQFGFAVLAANSATATDYCDYCPWFAGRPEFANPAIGACPGSAEVIAERTKTTEPPEW